MNLIKVENLTKTYTQGNETIFALNDVSFEVKKGEFIAVVGTCGSGKSTLIHMLACVDTPDSGRVFIDGHNVTSLKEPSLTIFRRREISLVYQFYNLIPTLDIENKIKLIRLLDGEEVEGVYYDFLISTFKLKDRLKHLPHQLSGGQQHEYLALDPLINKSTILLLDEPTGSLDKKNAHEIINIISTNYKNLNQTMILITHDDEIAGPADRIIRLEDGRIIRDEVGL